MMYRRSSQIGIRDNLHRLLRPCSRDLNVRQPWLEGKVFKRSHTTHYSWVPAPGTGAADGLAIQFHLPSETHSSTHAASHPLFSSISFETGFLERNPDAGALLPHHKRLNLRAPNTEWERMQVSEVRSTALVRCFVYFPYRHTASPDSSAAWDAAGGIFLPQRHENPTAAGGVGDNPPPPLATRGSVHHPNLQARDAPVRVSPDQDWKTVTFSEQRRYLKRKQKLARDRYFHPSALRLQHIRRIRSRHSPSSALPNAPEAHLDFMEQVRPLDPDTACFMTEGSLDEVQVSRAVPD